MTHPDLDKLEAALNRLKKGYAQFDANGTTYAVLYSPNNEVDLNIIEEAARAHLAAQRQGGDAVEGTALEAVHSAIESHRKGDLGEWELQLIATRIRSAHPPAVTGDRGALDALDDVLKWAEIGVQSAPRGASIPDLDWCGKTLRAALCTPAIADGVGDDVLNVALTALLEFVYQTTHLSACEPDGSHCCRISGDCLSDGRKAITALIQRLGTTPANKTRDGE